MLEMPMIAGRSDTYGLASLDDARMVRTHELNDQRPLRHVHMIHAAFLSCKIKPLPSVSWQIAMAHVSMSMISPSTVPPRFL